MVPVSTMNVPATAFRRVDLPDPLVPMTMRNEPAGSERETSVSALTSFKVPGLKVFEMRWISSIGSCHLGEGAPARLTCLQPAHQFGQNQCGEDKHRGNEFE